MADDSTMTIRATFATRAEAATADNTVGSAPSGGDVSNDEGARDDAPLGGEIEVSADIASSQIAAVQRSLGEAGAIRVTAK